MTTLAERLNEIREGAKQSIHEEVRAIMGKATNELRVSGIMDRALKDGDSLPSFELPNRNGEMFSSAELLQRGNLVLTFYRGVW
jgi:hypothetical protein